MRSRHEISLAVVTPKSWDNNQTKRGKFFEDFIGGILKILGYEVLSEVRVIGAEIDLLAKKDNPMENAVVECKFYKDLVSSEVLQKLIGVVTSEEGM